MKTELTAEKLLEIHLIEVGGVTLQINDNRIKEACINAINEAINYTHSCKSDSELLLCKHCDNKKVLHSEATGLCPDRLKHFEAK